MQDPNPIDAQNTTSEETQSDSVNQDNLNGANQEERVEVKPEAKKEDGCNKDCNKRLMVLLSILLILILLFGAFFAFQYFNKEEEVVVPPVVEDADEDEIVEDEVMEDEIDETVVNFVDYENPDYSGLNFVYPERAKVTMVPGKKDEVCTPELCYEVTIDYEELEVKIRSITGIGGRSSSPSLNHRILIEEEFSVTDPNYPEVISKYNGVLSSELKGSTSIIFDYSPFVEGVLVPVNSISISAELPTSEVNKYQYIADTIALSFYGKSYDENEIRWGVAYIKWDDKGDTQELYLIKEGGESVKANVDYQYPDEEAELVLVSPDTSYFALFSIIKQSPDRKVYFYNVSEGEFFVFDLDQSDLSFMSETEKWVSDTELVAMAYDNNDNNKYLKFDMESGEYSELTEAEYNNLKD